MLSMSKNLLLCFTMFCAVSGSYDIGLGGQLIVCHNGLIIWTIVRIIMSHVRIQRWPKVMTYAAQCRIRQRS